MQSVRIRAARPEDKERVFQLSAQAWADDYIPNVWESWLKERNGKVMVATIGGRVVGVAHAYMQTRDDAWLEGVRVDRAYRGKGIAGKLNKALVGYVAARGGSVARLSTDSDNTSSKRHLTRTGFKLLQVFERYNATRPLLRRPKNVKVLREFDQKLWSIVRKSQSYDSYKGLYANGWTFYPLTLQQLKGHVKSRSVTFSRTQDQEANLSLVIRGEKGLTLGYLSGTSAHAKEYALFARFLLSKSKSFQRVRALVPRGSPLNRAVTKAGFVKKGAMLVYENRLKSRR